ncbi:MAG: hypothetical protein IJ877_00780 [Candidatus Gastranaerophilales bacterium]|nr:hypothetical protein [Candidatus Gastranaerophilales bacterium]
MKNRFLNFVKWFFIVLGVLFLFEMLILSGIFMGFNSIKETEFKPASNMAKLKEIRPVIDYAEKYKTENNSYPKSVDVKLKNGEYTYETMNNSNCFKIIYKNKNVQKDYSKCSINTENSNSATESYSEITK